MDGRTKEMVDGLVASCRRVLDSQDKLIEALKSSAEWNRERAEMYKKRAEAAERSVGRVQVESEGLHLYLLALVCGIAVGFAVAIVVS